MGAKVESAVDGVITVRITGKLTQPDLALMLKSAAATVPKEGRIRVLVIGEDFEGWERPENWSDTSFQAQYDSRIDRMAIVGDQKWEDLALLFAAKGFRKFPIEFFSLEDISEARAWLAEGR